MGAPWEALRNGFAIEAVKTLKANGENAQVSYSAEADAWVLASKNVSLLARTRSDLKHYKKDRRY